MPVNVAKKLATLSEAGHKAYVADIAVESETNGNTPKTVAKLMAGFYDRM